MHELFRVYMNRPQPDGSGGGTGLLQHASAVLRSKATEAVQRLEPASPLAGARALLVGPAEHTGTSLWNPPPFGASRRVRQ